jgi:NAD(P)-dependent dehydrogenase (short-subunit alcohol dehydrogenase family)
VTHVTLVAGAGGAMGRACAHALAPATDVLLCTDVAEQRLAEAVRELTGTVDAHVCSAAGDLTDAAFVAELASRVRDLGTFGALVNTAGLSPSMAGWRAILQVDLVAPARLLDAFEPIVEPGSVAVHLASVSAHMGSFDPAMDALLDDALADDLDARFTALAGDTPDPGATYRLAKRAVIRLCDRAAVPWGAHGGRVLSVSPGLIDTEMGRLELEHNPIKTWLAETTPLGPARMDGSPLPGRITDIADAVAFLCSERASFISGCDIRVDGGLAGALGSQPVEHMTNHTHEHRTTGGSA